MNRLRLQDILESLLPQGVGKCPTVDADLLKVINEAQERLLFVNGETGWWGTWARMVFNVNRADNPYITLPGSVARLIDVDYCRRPIPVQNQFFEFLEAGIGLQGPNNCTDTCAVSMTFDRGWYPTFIDLEEGHLLRIFPTDTGDIGKEILVQGTDLSGMTLYSSDGTVSGVNVALASPFSDSPQLTTLTGIQKPVTVGPVQFYDVDVDTQESTLILTMEPQEEVASYRRYYLGGLPCTCCGDTTDEEDVTVQVTAMAKFEYFPVKVASDYLLIQNRTALIDECMAVRYGKMDTPAALQLAEMKHRSAIRQLNGQITHQLGKLMPAVTVSPFGTAHLSKQLIGWMT